MFLETKFYIFIFQGWICQRSGKMKSKKKYYDKYAPILAIHVDNHFSDKFISPCQVDYFINGNGRS